MLETIFYNISRYTFTATTSDDGIYFGDTQSAKSTKSGNSYEREYPKIKEWSAVKETTEYFTTSNSSSPI
jgi:hypothetical protein